MKVIPELRRAHYIEYLYVFITLIVLYNCSITIYFRRNYLFVFHDIG